MTVTRLYWQPQPQLNAFLRELERIDDRPRGSTSKPTINPQPRIETIESDRVFQVRVELPGIDRETIEVNASDRILWIAGRRQRDRTQGRVLLNELNDGTFEREIAFPEAIANTQITADLADGILTIVLPKQSAVRPTTVKIDLSSEDAPTPHREVATPTTDRLDTPPKPESADSISAELTSSELTEDVWAA